MRLGTPLVSDPSAKKIKKSEFLGVGALVQLIGVVCFFVIPWMVGVPAGIILLIAGSRMSYKWKCSNCGNSVAKDTKICPHPNCGARF